MLSHGHRDPCRDQSELSLTTVTSHRKPGFGSQLANTTPEPRAGRAGRGLLGEFLPASSTMASETLFAAGMKSEAPLDIPVLFQTDVLPLCRLSLSSGPCIALLSVSGGWLMKCFGAQDQVSCVLFADGTSPLIAAIHIGQGSRHGIPRSSEALPSQQQGTHLQDPT